MMIHRPRGAADINRSFKPKRGVGQGDFCATNCPVDGYGRINHLCGPPLGQNVQVFTNIATSSDFSGGLATLTYTVPVSEFCPEFFMILGAPANVADTSAQYIIEDIQGPDGSSMLIGTNPVMGEFFSPSNDRGNRIAGCCVRAGLTITVSIQWIGGGTNPPQNKRTQGSFWGAIR